MVTVLYSSSAAQTDRALEPAAAQRLALGRQRDRRRSLRLVSSLPIRLMVEKVMATEQRRGASRLRAPG
jgi:hypothetical protein